MVPQSSDWDESKPPFSNWGCPPVTGSHLENHRTASRSGRWAIASTASKRVRTLTRLHAVFLSQIAEVDDADLDTELVDALREMSFMQDEVEQRRLDRIESLPEGELKPALRALLNSLSTEQLEELAASSSEEEDSDEDIDRDGGSVAGRAKHPPAGMRVVALHATQHRCFKGHELSPMLSRPPEYADQGGPEEFVCDICGIEDQRYIDGVYHCTQCGDWDACFICVGGDNGASYAPIEYVPATVRAVPGGSSGIAGDRETTQRKVRRRRGRGGQKGGRNHKMPGGRRGKKR